MAHAAARTPDAESLPRWDLSDLYPGMESAELKRDLAEATRLVDAFVADYRGKVVELEAVALVEAIRRYEQMQEITGRIGSYASLLFAQDMGAPGVAQFYQNTLEALNDLGTRTLFFTLDLNKYEETTLAAYDVAHYGPWLRDLRAWRPYQLSDEIETLLSEQYVYTKAAWIRLFDETLAGLRVPVNGETLTLTDALNLLSSKDPEKRKAAAVAMGECFAQNAKLFALVTNTLAKAKEHEDGLRGFKRPVSSRNVANYVEDEVVDALAQSVRSRYSALSHRYYALKAKWFGVDALNYWDRNAPLPGDDDTHYTWDQARALVLDAYGAFSPKLADLGRTFFDNAWIDVPPTPGKASGAFAHPTVPSAHPYLLLNFHGKARDVMTLAHELGHGVHQLLSGKQGALMADTPLTLAETASVFGEQLTFREMLKRETDPARKKRLLAGKVEDMLNTVVRQIAFYTFEERLHDARREGELSAEDIAKLWHSVQGESLGPAIRFDETYDHYWSYISHFVHSPFYVYAYAFGDCLVNSLYGVYLKQGEAFVDKYFTMLEAGGTLRHKELLAPFGLDASQPSFWNEGLDVIAGMIRELEAMG